MPPKPSTDQRRITFTLCADDFHDLHQLAYQSRSSVSQLGRIAINRLLVDFDEGKLQLKNPQQGREPGHA